MATPTFWVAVGKIIWINVLLSGDNALVIALACRGLEPRQRLWGMIFGAGAAVRAADHLHRHRRDADGAALPQAGRRSRADRDRGQAAGAGSRRTRTASKSASHLWAAVQIVVVADIVMSLDNVIAVAAAANGSVPLLVLGLAISVPLIVAGAALIMALLDAPAGPGLGGCGAARLDCRRGDGDRSGIRAEAAIAVRWPARRQLDALLASLGMAPHSPMAATAASSCSACSASSSCWSRARSGAGGRCGSMAHPAGGG